MSAVECCMLTLKTPKEWPRSRHPLTNVGTLKTSELLLLAGPIGAYMFALLDIDDEIKKDMILVLRLLEKLMRKSSTPGDRLLLRRELPEAFTRLELVMPVYFSTMVVHYIVYHAVDHLEETGPFHVSNQLDMERFQTVLKGCCKGTKNVMRSIVNNYHLLKSALNTRLLSKHDWLIKPSTSTTAAYLEEADSAKRIERCYTVKGKCRSRKLGTSRFNQLEALWSQHNEEFAALVARFREDQKNHRTHGRRHLLVSSIADWRPRRKLTDREAQWVSMQPNVQVMQMKNVSVVLCVYYFSMLRVLN